MGELNPWHVVDVVISGLLGVLTWLGLKQISRIEALEREKASSQSVVNEVTRLENCYKEVKDVMRENQHATNVRLDNIFHELVNRQ